MKKKDVSVNEAVIDTEVTATPEATPEKPSKPSRKERDPKELHSILFAAAWIVGIIGIVFVFLAQNAMNNKDGFVSLSYHWFDEVLVDRRAQIYETQWTELFWDIEFLTTSLCSIIAMVLGFISTCCGVARNIIKKDKKLVSYIAGVVVLVLGVIAYMAAHYASLS